MTGGLGRGRAAPAWDGRGASWGPLRWRLVVRDWLPLLDRSNGASRLQPNALKPTSTLWKRLRRIGNTVLAAERWR